MIRNYPPPPPPFVGDAVTLQWHDWFRQVWVGTTPTPLTVARLPAADKAGVGARGFVTDATVTTFATVVVGGGANKVPVYSDGTNWLIG